VGDIASAAESDEFLPRTGIYVRPSEVEGEVAEPTVAAAPPAELEAAIEESVDRDEPGSNPLVDVFADLGLEEPEPGAPTEPLTGDLSIDLEGSVDEAAWSEEPVASLEEQLFSDGEPEEGTTDTEAAIDAALAEPVAARAAEEEVVGETTVVAPMPVEAGGGPPLHPAPLQPPRTGPPPRAP